MLDPKEVQRAVAYYNRALKGEESNEIELAAIKRLESIIEELILTMRDASTLIDQAYDLWAKGNIQPVVVAASTLADYPEDSSYPKSWWLQTIIPQIQSMKTHLETENGGGISPNEVFFAKPPKLVNIQETENL